MREAIVSKRRSFLLGALSVGVSGLVAACSPKPRKIVKSHHGGVEFKELVHKEPDELLPLIVPIHGLGGAPEHWVSGWMPFPGRSNIALPRGFNKHEDGYSWFPWNPDMNDEKLAADVSAAEERLWKGIAALARGRRVMVAGFTEGAMLSFVMALRHPENIVRAFPVVGSCPKPLIAKETAKAAPITAYHGTADDIIPITTVRENVEAIKKLGGDVVLREYAGVKHTATDKMHDDLRADMVAAMAAGK